MLDILLINLGKLIIFISELTKLGSGSTWPGHLALTLNKNFIKKIISKNKGLKIILIAGTNGKTTTTKLTVTIIEEYKKRVFQNESGANLLNGIASSLIKNSDFSGNINYDFGIFEVDENSLPSVLKNITPLIAVFLNLFRDQLDRYGETDTILNSWRSALKTISPKTTLIFNADDPKIAFLGTHYKNTKYFSVLEKSSKFDHASDSIYCPRCDTKLTYEMKTFSHLGIWNCPNCNLKKPKSDIENYNYYPLPGLYNKYNVNAAVLIARTIKIPEKTIYKSVKNFKPAFGRQELLKLKNKNIKILLSKNPASFNQSLDTIVNLAAKHLLIILNDNIPDGRDVSWIWDIDFDESINNFKSIFISGHRAYDMALRLKYSEIKNFKIYRKIKDAIDNQLSQVKVNETLYILPTYSAMLDLRKILTGKKLL